MSLIADGILILTCLTTALYCYVLSRRLSRLSNTDEGIGKQITQMNAGLEETRSAVKEIKATSKAASEALTREVAQARKIATQLSRLNEKAEELATRPYPAEPAQSPGVVLAPAAPEPPPAADPFLKQHDKADPTPARQEPDLPEITEEVVAEPDQPEPDDDAAAELNASDLSFFPEGRQQLGFLPEVDVMDDIEDDMTLGGGSEDGDDLFADGDLADLTTERDEEPQQSGVLKVERMAL